MLKFKKFVLSTGDDQDDGIIDDNYFPIYVHGSHANQPVKQSSPSSNVSSSAVVDEATESDYMNRAKYNGAAIHDLNRKLTNHYANGVSHAHQDALEKYTGGSSGLNRTLVSNHKNELVVGKYRKQADTLSDMASSKPAPFDFHVHSGLGFDPSKHMSSSGKIVSPAFLSSSIIPQVASDFAREDENGVKHIMRIKIPKGSNHGAYIQPFSSHEHEKEFLLNKGTTYKVNPKPLKLYDHQGNHTHSIWHAEPTNDKYENPHYDKEIPANKNKYLSKLVSSKDGFAVDSALIEHEKDIKPSHLMTALDHPNQNQRVLAAGHSKVNNAVLSKAMNDSNPEVRYTAAMHEKATSKHISKALEDSNEDVRRNVLYSRKIKGSHISKALDDPSEYVRQNAVRHGMATEKHISKALNDPSISVRATAIEHRNATAKHISHALKDPSETVRQIAIRHDNVTAQHIDQAMKDSDAGVRRYAIQSNKATHAHISQALYDPEESIRVHAAKHRNATEEHISQALKDPSYHVKKAALRNPNATHNNISQALNDPDRDVRVSALFHPAVTKEHIEKGLQDKDPNVRMEAEYLKSERS